MRTALTLAALVAATLTATAAPARAGWQPATTLTRGHAAFGATAAQSPDGRLAVGWLRQLSASSRASRAEVALASRAARFGRPVSLDASRQSLEAPVIAFERDGRLDAVWRRYFQGNHRLWSRALSPGGRLGAVRHLTGPGESAYDAQFATRPGQDPWLSWDRRTPPSFLARFTGGGAGSSERGPGGTIFNGAAAVGPGGGVLLTWLDRGVQAAYRPPGGAFGTPVRLSQSTAGLGDPRPAFFGDRMAVVFGEYEAGTYRMRIASAPEGGSFGPVATVTGADESAHSPQPVGLASGELDILYLSREPGTPRTTRVGTPRLVRVGTDGQPAGAIRSLDHARRAAALHAAASSTSGAYAAWWVDGQVRAVRLAPGGIVGTTRRLSSRDEEADRGISVAAGATGSDDGLVAWTTTHGAVRAARYAAR